jgi:proteic killer suppression protein
MLRTFKDKELEKLFDGRYSKSQEKLHKRARYLLYVMDAAVILEDLATIPGGNLEQLIGNREGLHSLRVSGNWRLCFIWNNGNIDDVELVDYH